MDKKFWGPPTWNIIHIVAAAYEPSYKYSMISFLHSLPELLPCDNCKENLLAEYKKLPFGADCFKDNRNMFLWTFLLHNNVNNKLKKPTPKYALSEKYFFENCKNPKYWGPFFWKVIHSFAASYRPAAKESFVNFINSLPGIIPCVQCKKKLNELLANVPLTDEYLLDNNRLFLWSFIFHDMVNKGLKKTSPPFEMVKAIYFDEKICKKCGL